MKKTVSILIVFVIIFANFIAYGTNMAIIDERAQEGILEIYFNNSSATRFRLLVEKDGTRYTYNLASSEEIQQFPLQMGNGSYTIRIMENVEGNSYRTISRKNVEVNIKNQEIVFLNSNQIVSWNEDSLAVKKAKELTEGLQNEEEKLQAIYNFIVNNITYDFDKINDLNSTYLPNIDETLISGQGICYDYSALFAAMLRSVGIPTKLVKGYTSLIADEYHAWNQVFINGEWKTIDTTYDAAFVQANRKVSMFKDSSLFEGARFF